MGDYVCIITWDPLLEITRYHYVHKSVKDPSDYIKNMYPEEIEL